MNVLEILPSRQGYSIQVQYGVSERAYYKFDSDFRLLDVQASPGLMRSYNDRLRRGILHKPLEQFLAERGSDFWRWNGAGWLDSAIKNGLARRIRFDMRIDEAGEKPPP